MKSELCCSRFPALRNSLIVAKVSGDLENKSDVCLNNQVRFQI